MRANLAHMGGVWNYYGGSAGTYTEEVARLIASGEYPYLYTDFGDLSNILDRDASDHTSGILCHVRDLVEANPILRERVLYGTDFILLGREPGFKRYYEEMNMRMQRTLGAQQVDGLLADNAVRYLGLAAGEETRKRLEAFYSCNRQSPDKLRQFSA